MHPCLSVDEIIRLLVRELVWSEAKGSAVAFGCCCKNLEDPVLDVLWATQVRMTPLLKCLPQDTWEDFGTFVSWLIIFNSSAVSHRIRKTFKRNPTETEWVSFRKYALRMRNLELDIYKDPAVWEILLLRWSQTTDDPWLPRLKNFQCENSTKEFIPFIPFFLSRRITKICIGFIEGTPAEMIGPIIRRLPTLCPGLKDITLGGLARDSVITDAVSEMLLTCNRDSLRTVFVDSELTEEARKVVYQLPKLSDLGTIIEGRTLLPTVWLPNLSLLYVNFDDCLDWLQGFRGARFERLEVVSFDSKCERVGDFLEAFQSIALTTSAQSTLLFFDFRTSRSWNPNYRPLLPFTQLETLSIKFACDVDCSSMVDDNMITDLARAMPRLKTLRLGDMPCEASTGITIKGLTALARHCRHLSELRIHFRADTIVEAVTSQETPSFPDAVAMLHSDCALTLLEVGRIPIPETGAATVAKGLIQIFPRLRNIQSFGGQWSIVALKVWFSRMERGEAQYK